MKKITIVLLIMLVMMLAGCTTIDKTQSETPSDSFYQREENNDYWKIVYVEGNMKVWVLTLDNTVWITYNGSGLTKCTTNGQDVIWQGSMEHTFGNNNIPE